MLSKTKIEAELVQYIGTEQYFKNALLTFQYTDGIKFLWESCESYWLLIAIASHRRKESFQLWELKVNDNKSATLTMKEDSDEPNLVVQEIGFTDFPLDTISLYLIDGILLLPSEY